MILPDDRASRVSRASVLPLVVARAELQLRVDLDQTGVGAGAHLVVDDGDGHELEGGGRRAAVRLVGQAPARNGSDRTRRVQVFVHGARKAAGLDFLIGTQFLYLEMADFFYCDLDLTMVKCIPCLYSDSIHMSAMSEDSVLVL